MQTHKDPNISVRDFDIICSIIGQPMLLDAARFGASVHRLRNFWTNLAAKPYLQGPEPVRRYVVGARESAHGSGFGLVFSLSLNMCITLCD